MAAIICDWCDKHATRVDDSDGPMCNRCAREHYGTDWRAVTRILGKRALAAIAARAARFA